MNKIDCSQIHSRMVDIKSIPAIVADTIWRKRRNYYGHQIVEFVPGNLNSISGLPLVYVVLVSQESTHCEHSSVEANAWDHTKQPIWKFKVQPVIKLCRLSYPDNKFTYRIAVDEVFLKIWGPDGFKNYIVETEFDSVADAANAIKELNQLIEYDNVNAVVVYNSFQCNFGIKSSYVIPDLYSTVEDAYKAGNDAIVKSAKETFDTFKKNRLDELKKLQSKYTKNLVSIQQKVDGIDNAIKTISDWKLEPPKEQKCPEKSKEKILGKLDITVTVTAEE